MVELRSVPDCPNLAPVRQALFEALATLGLPAHVEEVVGDYPSPSVLVNGVDVIGGTGHGPAACRLDLPTIEQLHAALQQAAAAESATAQPAECCTPSEGGILGDRPQRLARLPHPVRQVYRAVLRYFATTATAPGEDDLHQAARAAGVDLTTALNQLAHADVIAIDTAGRLIAAYPFSPTPTRHQVHLGNVTVFAMCAIDALGMPYMLNTDAVITSTDPHTRQQIRVAITDQTAAFHPFETVVVFASTATTGPSVDTCCSTINFFATPDNAQAWLDANPAPMAKILNQHDALTLGRSIFQPLLT
jgi:hypothetical protein